MSVDQRSRGKGSTERSLDFGVCIDRPGFRLDVDGEIGMQRVVSIVGPSGSGKSTLLRAIAGFEVDAQGRISFADQVWLDSAQGIRVPAYQRPIGMLFQEGRLFDHLDVAANIAFGARYRAGGRNSGAGAGFDEAEVRRALDLEPLLRRLPRTLSGGEKQRVALARTLVSKPHILLLDEPLSGMDRGRKSEILPYLERVTRELEIPTLFVSHDVDEVARLAEEVWLLSEGRIVKRGPTAEIIEGLDREPWAREIEPSVLLAGRVARHEPRLHLTFVEMHGDEMTMPIVEGLEPGDPVRFRVRARDVALATHRPVGLSIRNIIAGTLADLEQEEGTGTVTATVALREDRIRARLTLAAVEELNLCVGDSVFALIKSVSFEPFR